MEDLVKHQSKCVECGSSFDGPITKFRCDSCREERKHRSRSKFRLCLTCGKEFYPKTSQVYCADCRPLRGPDFIKLVECKICGVRYPKKRASPHICRLCHENLISQGRTFCILCNKVVELKRVSKLKTMLCLDHIRIKSNEYKRIAKLRGKHYVRSYKYLINQSIPEKNKILDELDKGLTVRQIAKKLKFSEKRVLSALKTTNSRSIVSRKRIGRSGWMTTLDIRNLMGWSSSYFNRYKKYLKMLPYGFKRRRSGPVTYIIKAENFDTWLRDYSYWMLWDLNDIKDSSWRDYCASFRNDNEYWMTSKEASVLVNYDSDSVSRWMKNGQLKGLMRNRVWYLWSADLREFMLDKFGRDIKT